MTVNVIKVLHNILRIMLYFILFYISEIYPSTSECFQLLSVFGPVTNYSMINSQFHCRPSVQILSKRLAAL